VQVARILRFRGNKGEVAAALQTDFPERFSSLTEVYLRKDDGEPKAVRLQRFWMDRNHPGEGIFHFADCTTISEAEKWRGYDVLLPFEQRVQLPEGQFFVTDLIGCRVFELPATAESVRTTLLLGTVNDVFFPSAGVPGIPLLQVQTKAGELLIPLAEDICKLIDIAGRRIDVTLPEGLRDVNG